MVDGRDADDEPGVFDNLAEPCPWLAEQSSALSSLIQGVPRAARKPVQVDVSALAQISDACAEAWTCSRLA
jgi:hypothetical protein